MIVRFKQRPCMAVNLNFPDWLDKENRPMRKSSCFICQVKHHSLELQVTTHLAKIPRNSIALVRRIGTSSTQFIGFGICCCIWYLRSLLVSLLCVGILRSSHAKTRPAHLDRFSSHLFELN